MLRGLVLEGVLAEEDGGRFALTAVGEWLRRDLSGSLRGPVVVRGELYYQAAAGLLAAVRHGGTAFEQVYGDRFFDYLARHPEQEAVFQGSMTGRAEQEAGDVVAAYDFGGWPAGRRRRRLRHPARDGAPGGAGPPGRPGRPAGGGGAGPPAAGGRRGRRALPAGRRRLLQLRPGRADAYLLSRVLHDWADEDARRLLAACRSAMTPASRLLVVEALLPEHAADQPAVIRMDLHMLVLLGARERTEAQYRGLLAETGFQVRRVVATGSPAGLSVIEATLAG